MGRGTRHDSCELTERGMIRTNKQEDTVSSSRWAMMRVIFELFMAMYRCVVLDFEHR